MPKTHTIGVRVDDATYEKFLRAAAFRGHTISSWLRYLASRELEDTALAAATLFNVRPALVPPNAEQYGLKAVASPAEAARVAVGDKVRLSFPKTARPYIFTIDKVLSWGIECHAIVEDGSKFPMAAAWHDVIPVGEDL